MLGGGALQGPALMRMAPSGAGTECATWMRLWGQWLRVGWAEQLTQLYVPGKHVWGRHGACPIVGLYCGWPARLRLLQGLHSCLGPLRSPSSAVAGPSPELDIAPLRRQNAEHHLKLVCRQLVWTASVAQSCGHVSWNQPYSSCDSACSAHTQLCSSCVSVRQRAASRSGAQTTTSWAWLLREVA